MGIRAASWSRNQGVLARLMSRSVPTARIVHVQIFVILFCVEGRPFPLEWGSECVDRHASSLVQRQWPRRCGFLPGGLVHMRPTQPRGLEPCSSGSFDVWLSADSTDLLSLFFFALKA